MHQVIAKSIEYLVKKENIAANLDDLEKYTGYNKFYLQKTFKERVGLSPQQFQHYLNVNRAKRDIHNFNNFYDLSNSLGLSSSSRLHDLFLKIEKVTPGEFKKANYPIYWAVFPTVFGDAIFCATEKGLCRLAFLNSASKKAREEELKNVYPKHRLVFNSKRLAPYADELKFRFQGKTKQALSLVLKGTELQMKVWEALLEIPFAQVTSYAQVAAAIDRPKAVRAVASAVGQNNLSFLIPCHRVLRSTGAIGGYRWGLERKRFMLASELHLQ